MTEKLFRDFMILKQRTDRHVECLLETSKEKTMEFHELQLEIKVLRDTLADRRQELNSLIHEINSQKNKIDRADLLTRRLLKQMGHFGSEERNLIESEIKLRCLREKYQVTWSHSLNCRF